MISTFLMFENNILNDYFLVVMVVSTASNLSLNRDRDQNREQDRDRDRHRDRHRDREYMSLGVGVGLKYPLPPMQFSLKATLPPPKMAFLKKFLTFFAKKWHLFRKFLGPLGIITNLQ